MGQKPVFLNGYSKKLCFCGCLPIINYDNFDTFRLILQKYSNEVVSKELGKIRALIALDLMDSGKTLPQNLYTWN